MRGPRLPRTQGRPARGSRRPAGGARTGRDGPGGEPGIPSLARRRRRPPRDQYPLMGLGGLVQRMQGGGPAQGLQGLQGQLPPPGMGMGQPGLPPPGGMGLQGMGQQQQQPMAMGLGGYQEMPMGLPPMPPSPLTPQEQGLLAQSGNLYGQGQQRQARRQLAETQPGRGATRGIGPGMAYGGVPRLQGGMQVPPRPGGPGPGMPPGGLPRSPMGPGMAPPVIPPGGPGGGPPLGGGGNRLDALRGVIPGGLPPLVGGGGGGDVIEEEGGTAGLSTAIADTLESNTSGIDEQLSILQDVQDQLLSRAGEEEDITMADEGLGGLGDILGGGAPDIGAILGGGRGAPDIEEMLG